MILYAAIVAFLLICAAACIVGLACLVIADWHDGIWRDDFDDSLQQMGAALATPSPTRLPSRADGGIGTAGPRKPAPAPTLASSPVSERPGRPTF